MYTPCRTSIQNDRKTIKYTLLNYNQCIELLANQGLLESPTYRPDKFTTCCIFNNYTDLPGELASRDMYEHDYDSEYSIYEKCEDNIRRLHYHTRFRNDTTEFWDEFNRDIV